MVCQTRMYLAGPWTERHRSPRRSKVQMHLEDVLSTSFNKSQDGQQGDNGCLHLRSDIPDLKQPLHSAATSQKSQNDLQGHNGCLHLRSDIPTLERLRHK